MDGEEERAPAVRKFSEERVGGLLGGINGAVGGGIASVVSKTRAEFTTVFGFQFQRQRDAYFGTRICDWEMGSR